MCHKLIYSQIYIQPVCKVDNHFNELIFFLSYANRRNHPVYPPPPTHTLWGKSGEWGRAISLIVLDCTIY